VERLLRLDDRQRRREQHAVPRHLYSRLSGSCTHGPPGSKPSLLDPRRCRTGRPRRGWVGRVQRHRTEQERLVTGRRFPSLPAPFGGPARSGRSPPPRRRPWPGPPAPRARRPPRTHTHTAATPVGECPFATPVSTARSASRRASRSTSRPSPSRTGERSAPNGRSAAVTEAAVPCRATVRRRRGTCLLLRPVAHRRGVRQAVHPDRPPGAGVRNSTNGGPSTVGCYRTPDGSVRTDGGMRDDSWNGRRRWRR
jgi:hypothetical protein